MVPRGQSAASHFASQIDYGTAEALTTYGLIGVKVWVFRGEKEEEVEVLEPLAS